MSFAPAQPTPIPLDFGERKKTHLSRNQGERKSRNGYEDAELRLQSIAVHDPFLARHWGVFKANCGKVAVQIHQVDDFTVAVVLRVVLAYPHWEHSDQMLSASSTMTSTKNTRKIARKNVNSSNTQGADLPEKRVFPVFGSTSKARLRYAVGSTIAKRGQRTAEGCAAPQPLPPLPHDTHSRTSTAARACNACSVSVEQGDTPPEANHAVPPAAVRDSAASRTTGTEHTATFPRCARPSATSEGAGGRKCAQAGMRRDNGLARSDALRHRTVHLDPSNRIFRPPQGAVNKVAVTGKFNLIVGRQSMQYGLSRDAMPEFGVEDDSTRKTAIPGEMPDQSG
ncbi:hypothetical protein DFH06DRAFT_1298079 [Mycena polygramma]|nr:hypothetical protein DFH06DRAFT_1298079 [Mycena polygramma]